MKSVKLFVDCTIPDGKNTASENSHKIVNFIAQNMKTINMALIVMIVPIRTSNDKKVLVENGVTKLPTLLDDTNNVVGIESIKAFINKHINGVRRNAPKDDADVLREEQMAEMDMEKYENGDYDDDDEDGDDVFVKGDKDARKENLQQKMAEFNSRRKGRIEETKPSKRGSKKKKTGRRPAPKGDDDEEPDNIDTGPRRGGNKETGTDLNMEDWDPETQQLLDKAGN